MEYKLLIYYSTAEINNRLYRIICRIKINYESLIVLWSKWLKLGGIRLSLRNFFNIQTQEGQNLDYNFESYLLYFLRIML